MSWRGPDANQEQDAPDEPEWDANDPRRQNDQFAPPAEPCECFCAHCRRTFMSDEIWFQKINGARDGFDGFWMCPTPNCGGAGFTFDIFPNDPSHPANNSFSNHDEDECGQDWEQDFEAENSAAEYDPSEPHYQMLDEWACDDDDLEGEEWKLGLEPGERPEPDRPQWLVEEEKKYQEPDRRPREVDWNDTPRSERGQINDEDIPF